MLLLCSLLDITSIQSIRERNIDHVGSIIRQGILGPYHAFRRRLCVDGDHLNAAGRIREIEF